MNAKFKNRPVMASLELITPFAQGKKVVDLGCSIGSYLQHFSEESIGIEIERAEVDFCRAKGLNVIYGDLNGKLKIGDGEHEVAFCSHVLEHLESPIQFLRECYRILSKDGLLILGLPYEGTLSQLLGKDNYFYGHIGHLHSFTIDNIKLLLTETGFNVVEIFVEPWPKEKLRKIRILTNYLKLIQRFPRRLALFLSNGYWIISQKIES